VKKFSVDFEKFVNPAKAGMLGKAEKRILY
jgi:hypothetical protein